MPDDPADEIPRRMAERDRPDFRQSQSTVERLVRVEQQLERLASDIESEKRTRAEANKGLHDKMESMENKIDDRLSALDAQQDKRFRFLERTVWAAIGAFAIIEVVLRFWPKGGP